MTNDGRSMRGFTLLELLIVVVIIGVVASIAIPGLLNALDRGKQKRTMADIKTIATAIESYSIDNASFPVATDPVTLGTLIEPFFTKRTPTSDGWNHSLIVDSSASGYTLGSGGKDGGSLNFVGGETHDFDDAIIFIDGQFIQWPEGAQQ